MTCMQLAYYDEAGDDGFPKYSSPLFVLSALYLHYLNWKKAFETIREFRQQLRSDFGLPVKTELHTKYLILGKDPYRDLKMSDATRLEIVGLFCDLIATLDIRVVNVAIVKQKIIKKNYEVLDTALTYSVQRIENDLKPAVNPENRFILITDPGRVGKMRKTTRRVQRFNYIPSKFATSPYRSDIRCLIEDPLPKDSSESFFIQLADLVAQIVYYHALIETGSGTYPSRAPTQLSAKLVESWLDRLSPSLNLQASSSHRFGIVYHPK
jgi:hypothetical protein